jgi:flagellar motor switch protein FliG
MSRNAAVTIKEDVDFLSCRPPLREEDKREAQQKIIDVILLLTEQGEIII